MLNTGLHELLPKYVYTYNNTHYGLASSYRTDAYVFCIPYNNKKSLTTINLKPWHVKKKNNIQTDIGVELDMVSIHSGILLKYKLLKQKWKFLVYICTYVRYVYS